MPDLLAPGVRVRPPPHPPEAAQDLTQGFFARLLEKGGETFIGGTGGATTHLEPGGLAIEPLVFYEVRAVNSCEWEGP